MYGASCAGGYSVKKVAPEFELLADPTVWTSKPDRDDLVKGLRGLFRGQVYRIGTNNTG